MSKLKLLISVTRFGNFLKYLAIVEGLLSNWQILNNIVQIFIAYERPDTEQIV